MSKFEKKFGKYAIPNLSLILVICYVVGYLIQYMDPNGEILMYLTLDPYQILFHGQVWRLITWILIPPTTMDIFTVLMLFFYYSLGTALERTWGTYRYNVYILGGIIITILSAFVGMGVCYLLFGDYLASGGAVPLFMFAGAMFSTYYINMSIFLAFSITYPEHQVLLMFVVPVKVKWMGIVYGALLVLSMLEYLVSGFEEYPGYWFGMVAIAASLINFLIFWLRSKRLGHLAPKQIMRRVEFKQQVKEGEKQSEKKSVHKCSICGRTDVTNPELEFRYCSKCVGNHAYCQDHLFTHEHKV